MMTSRERVLAALAHKPTDRMPADFGAQTSVTEALVKQTGVADTEELLVSLGVDMRAVWFDYSQPDTGPDADGYCRTMWGGRRRSKDAPVLSPFTEDSTVDDVHAHAWPDPDRLDYSKARAQCAKHHDRYITYGSTWSPFFHEIGWLIGQEPFLEWMHTKPEVVHAILTHMVDYEIETTRRFFESTRGVLDIAYFGNDFGTQRGCFISPKLWQTFIRPPLKRYFDLAHDFGCLVMQHSCGSIRDLIPALIEDGVDILDPIQTAATGMDLAGLVRDFGERLVFHGGMDTQTLMPFGSADDVRAQVRAYRDLTRARGGYILCGSQAFIADIPLDNILAMYDENRKTA
jgi:uroporphyrinogen decarboxylase